jgi:hypothetical protein
LGRRLSSLGILAFPAKHSTHGFPAWLCQLPKTRFNCFNGSRQKRRNKQKATQGVFDHALGARPEKGNPQHMKNQNQAKGKVRKTRSAEPAKSVDPVPHGMWMTLNAATEFLRTHRLIEHEYIFVALSKAEVHLIDGVRIARKRSGKTVIDHLEEGILRTLFQLAAKSSVNVELSIPVSNIEGEAEGVARLELSRRRSGK